MLALYETKLDGKPRRPSDPVPVLVTSARIADVPVYLDGVGTAEALNAVTVRSQVDGKIIAISFVEGQDVPKGFVLARIDPTTYQAQYDQAVAKKAQDEAQPANVMPGSISTATPGWRRPTPCGLCCSGVVSARS